MTRRSTMPNETRSQVRRLLAQTFLQSANAAIAHGAHPDDVSAALIAVAVDFGRDVVPVNQLATELRALADELDQLHDDNRPN